jgi:hypothetical protein
VQRFNASTFLLLASLLFIIATNLAAQSSPRPTQRTFAVKGVIVKIEPGEGEVLIQNEAISARNGPIIYEQKERPVIANRPLVVCEERSLARAVHAVSIGARGKNAVMKVTQL